LSLCWLHLFLRHFLLHLAGQLEPRLQCAKLNTSTSPAPSHESHPDACDHHGAGRATRAVAAGRFLTVTGVLASIRLFPPLPGSRLFRCQHAWRAKIHFDMLPRPELDLSESESADGRNLHAVLNARAPIRVMIMPVMSRYSHGDRLPLGGRESEMNACPSKLDSET
jgi:hypothetical protein